MSPTPRTKRFAARTLAAGIAAFALATAGIALAASGNLPGNGQGNGFGNDDDQVSQVVESEASDENDQGEDEQGDTSTDEVTDETDGDESSESPTEDTDESTTEGFRGVCRAITVGNKAEHGKALEAPPFVALVEAAGGIENVKAYCTEQFGESTKPAKGERPEKPTKPEHPDQAGTPEQAGSSDQAEQAGTPEQAGSSDQADQAGTPSQAVGADRRLAGCHSQRPAFLRALEPRFLGVHLLAIVLVAIAGWLGAWQYAAWQADRAAQSQSFADVDPVPLADVIGPDDAFPGLDNGRPVDVRGEWLPEATVYVSGRTDPAGEDPSQPGYWVVTPIAVGGGDGAAFPVVRGWTEAPELAPPAPTGPADLTAWLQAPEGAGDADQDPLDNVVPTLRIAEVVQRLDRDAYGGFGIAVEPTAGLEAVGSGAGSGASWSTGLRNLFYAFEWWFFGGFAVFAWWRYMKDELSESEG